MMGEASEPLLKLELERASEFLSLEPLPDHFNNFSIVCLLLLRRNLGLSDRLSAKSKTTMMTSAKLARF